MCTRDLRVCLDGGQDETFYKTVGVPNARACTKEFNLVDSFCYVEIKLLVNAAQKHMPLKRRHILSYGKGYHLPGPGMSGDLSMT